MLITPVSNTSEIEETVVDGGAGGWFANKIALIEVEGMIANAREGGLLQPGENKVSLFQQQLDAAAGDPRVKAVVLRINSPGGTVTASDTVYQIVRRFREKTGKPVVANAQEVCASGGYYIACAADRFVVHPTSVVGSIGVIFNTFDASGTMAKIGLRSEAIKSGPLKDLGSPFKPLTADERAVLQGMIDEYYGRFVGVVTSRRPITDRERLKLVTDGRVFSGARAVELGLADETGLLPDAIDRARELGKAPGAKVVMYKRPYGYGGSIYASSSTPRPHAAGQQQTGVMQLELKLPESRATLPHGFYYLWEP